MFKKLVEAINVPGAQLIGTAKGYDLFDISTYHAAQQFVIENTAAPAGQIYCHNEQTFNANINEHQHLYFFVEQNTNRVYAAAVKSNTTAARITIRGSNEQVQVTIDGNFMFEANGANNVTKILPLFLIPGCQFNGVIGNLVVANSSLNAVLPQLVAAEAIDLDLSSSDNIRRISQHAFKYGMHINTLTIGDNIDTLASNNMFDNVDHIVITWIEKPAGWVDNWDDGYQDKITYSNAEEIERIRVERAANAERLAAMERSRLEREVEQERQRLEQEILKAERYAKAMREKAEQEAKEKAAYEQEQKLRADKQQKKSLAALRYKREGQEITIVGVNPSYRGSINIPEKIDGLPVTKIGAFAFYKNTNIDNIELPLTIKFVDQGSFSYTQLESAVKLTYDCKIHRNAFFNAKRGVDRVRGPRT